jgi:hypothetical protein
MALLAVANTVEVEIHYMAPGQKVYLPEDKAWGKGFNLEEYKVLLQMDDDLYTARKQLRLVDFLEEKWTLVLEQKDEVIESYKADIKILDEKSTRLDNRWKKCEDDLIKASGGQWWLYGLAIGGSVIGIIGTSLYLGAVTSN